MTPIVVKPPVGKIVLLGMGWLLFTVLAVVFLFAGDALSVVLGVAGILCFTLGGGYFLLQLARARATFTLDERGFHPGNGGVVAWENVTKVGKTRATGTNAVGIRLREAGSYEKSLTPQEGHRLVAAARRARRFGPLLGMQPSKEAAPINDVPSVLAWSRANTDFDLTYGSLTLGESVDKTIEQVERYRSEALRRRRRGKKHD